MTTNTNTKAAIKIVTDTNSNLSNELESKIKKAEADHKTATKKSAFDTALNSLALVSVQGANNTDNALSRAIAAAVKGKTIDLGLAKLFTAKERAFSERDACTNYVDTIAGRSQLFRDLKNAIAESKGEHRDAMISVRGIKTALPKKVLIARLNTIRDSVRRLIRGVAGIGKLASEGYKIGTLRVRDKDSMLQISKGADTDSMSASEVMRKAPASVKGADQNRSVQQAQAVNVETLAKALHDKIVGKALDEFSNKAQTELRRLMTALDGMDIQAMDRDEYDKSA
jgi:phage tail tube protein FII